MPEEFTYKSLAGADKDYKEKLSVLEKEILQKQSELEQVKKKNKFLSVIIENAKEIVSYVRKLKKASYDKIEGDYSLFIERVGYDTISLDDSSDLVELENLEEEKKRLIRSKENVHDITGVESVAESIDSAIKEKDKLMEKVNKTLKNKDKIQDLASKIFSYVDDITQYHDLDQEAVVLYGNPETARKGTLVVYFGKTDLIYKDIEPEDVVEGSIDAVIEQDDEPGKIKAEDVKVREQLVQYLDAQENLSKKDVQNILQKTKEKSFISETVAVIYEKHFKDAPLEYFLEWMEFKYYLRGSKVKPKKDVIQRSKRIPLENSVNLFKAIYNYDSIVNKKDVNSIVRAFNEAIKRTKKKGGSMRQIFQSWDVMLKKIQNKPRLSIARKIQKVVKFFDEFKLPYGFKPKIFEEVKNYKPKQKQTLFKLIEEYDVEKFFAKKAKQKIDDLHGATVSPECFFDYLRVIGNIKKGLDDTHFSTNDFIAPIALAVYNKDILENQEYDLFNKEFKPISETDLSSLKKIFQKLVKKFNVTYINKSLDNDLLKKIDGNSFLERVQSLDLLLKNLKKDD